MSYPAMPSYQVDFPEFGYNVTPNDTFTAAGFPCPFKMIIVGGAGNVRYIDMGGNTVTLTGALAGYQYWLCGKQIMATGTSATNILALV